MSWIKSTSEGLWGTPFCTDHHIMVWLVPEIISEFHWFTFPGLLYHKAGSIKQNKTTYQNTKNISEVNLVYLIPEEQM